MSGWPDTASLVMPRDPDDRAPDPILDVLALSIQPWTLQPIAHRLRELGFPIPRKAEAENAAALHWLIGIALEVGADWRAAVFPRLDQLAAAKPAAAE